MAIDFTDRIRRAVAATDPSPTDFSTRIRRGGASTPAAAPAPPARARTYAGATAAQLGIEQPDTPEALDELFRVRPDDQEVSPLRSIVVGAKQLTPGAIESTLGPSSQDRIGGVPYGVAGKVAGAPGVAQYETVPGEFDERNREILEANEAEAGASFRRNPISHTAGNALALLLGGVDAFGNAPGAAARGAAGRGAAALEGQADDLARRSLSAADVELFDETAASLKTQRHDTTLGNKAAMQEFGKGTYEAKLAAEDATEKARAAAEAEARRPTEDKSLAIFGLEDSPGQRYVRDPLEATEQGRELYAMETPGQPGKPLHQTLLEMPAEQRARYALQHKGEAGSVIGGFRNALPNVAGAEVAAAPLKSSVRRALVDLPQELKTEEIARLYGRIDEATNYKTVAPAALRELIEETERLAGATSDEALRRAYYSVRKVLVDREKALIVRHFPEEAPQYLQALVDWQNWDDVAFGSKRLLERANRASIPRAPSADVVNFPDAATVEPTRPFRVPRPEAVSVELPKFPGGPKALEAARGELQPPLPARVAARAVRGTAVTPGIQELTSPVADWILRKTTPNSESLMQASMRAKQWADRLRQLAPESAQGIEATLVSGAAKGGDRLAATVSLLSTRHPQLRELLVESLDLLKAADGPAPEEGEGEVRPGWVQSDARTKREVRRISAREVVGGPTPAAPDPSPRAASQPDEDVAYLRSALQRRLGREDAERERPREPELPRGPRRYKMRITKRDENGDILEIEREDVA